MPDVTVVLLSWNQARFAREAVAGIAAQTGVDLEVIAVDNGSTDGSADVVADEAARLGLVVRQIRNPDNLGICRAYNQALAEAKGEWLALCAADDRFLPGRLGLQLKIARELPDDVAILTGRVLRIDGDGAPVLEDDGSPSVYPDFLADDPVQYRLDLIGGRGPAMIASLVRRSALVDLGGFDERIGVEDVGTFLGTTFTLGLRTVYHPDIVSDYRIHGTNASTRWQAMLDPLITAWTLVPTDRMSREERAARRRFLRRYLRLRRIVRRQQARRRGHLAWMGVRTAALDGAPDARARARALLGRRDVPGAIRARALLATAAPGVIRAVARGRGGRT